MSDTEDARARNVRQRAYFIWQQEGCPDGRADDHWHQAWEMEGGGATAGAVTESAAAGDLPAPAPAARKRAAGSGGPVPEKAMAAPAPAKARRKAGRR